VLTKPAIWAAYWALAFVVLDNVQTPLNVAYFYALLASPTGRVPPPHLVEVQNTVPVRELRLTGAVRADLRAALVAVVEGGTAAASRIADLHIGGKTGTAQNPQGEDHGWFVAFAPAEAPEVVVAAIVEFAEQLVVHELGVPKAQMKTEKWERPGYWGQTGSQRCLSRSTEDVKWYWRRCSH